MCTEIAHLKVRSILITDLFPNALFDPSHLKHDLYLRSLGLMHITCVYYARNETKLQEKQVPRALL